MNTQFLCLLLGIILIILIIYKLNETFENIDMPNYSNENIDMPNYSNENIDMPNYSSENIDMPNYSSENIMPNYSQPQLGKKYYAYNLNSNKEEYILILYSQLSFKLQVIICDLIINDILPIKKDLNDFYDLKESAMYKIRVLPQNNIIFAIKLANIINSDIINFESRLIFDDMNIPYNLENSQTFKNVIKINVNINNNISLQDKSNTLLLSSSNTLLSSSNVNNVTINKNTNLIGNKFVKLVNILELPLYQIVLDNNNNNVIINEEIIII